MKKFLLALIATIFTVATNAQTIDFTYQGWSTQSGKSNLSLYIARDGFKLGSAFNDENYPVWYVENQEIDIVSGVVNYRLRNVNLDSLVKYTGNLYLYVAINGTPHDTIIMDPSPYAGTALVSNRANSAKLADFATDAAHAAKADTSVFAVNARNAVDATNSVNANEALHALRADTALYAREAGHAVRSDVSLYASSSAHAVWADSASYAVLSNRSRISDSAALAGRAILADSAINAGHASTANEADHADHSDSANVSANAHFVYANGVNLAAIAAVGAENGSTLTTDGTSLQWRRSTRIEGRTQLTLVPLNSIDGDVRTLIYRVAQDFNSPLPAASEGRIITLVNSSTANFITIQSGIWNIWGGDVVIGPRNSATILYTSGQWVVIAQ